MKKKIREKLDRKMARIKTEMDFLDNFDVDVENIGNDAKKLLMKTFCDFVHRCDRAVTYAEYNCSYVELFDYMEKWFD